MDGDTKMLDAALWYAAQGWDVFPVHGVIENGDGTRRCTCGAGDKCKEAGKHPATKHGFNDATKDETRIRAWWENKPDWNIATPITEDTGRLVVDVDPRRGGADAIAAFEAERGPLPVTLTADTGGNGEHRILIRPRDGGPVPQRTDWLPGVDIKANGYIVIAPSRHISGGVYRWRNWGAGIGYPTQVLLDSIREHGSNGSAVEGQPGEWMRPLVEGLAFRNRDDGMVEFAAQALLHMDRAEDAWALCRLVYQRIADTEDFGLDQLDKCFRQALKLDRVKDGREARGLTATWLSNPAEPGWANPDGLTFRSLRDVHETYSSPSWVIRNFVLRGAFGVIGGSEKALKSWSAIGMSVAVATGRPCFGSSDLTVPEAGPVMILSGEGGDDLVHDRIELMCRIYGVPFDSVWDSIHTTDVIVSTSEVRFKNGIVKEIGRIRPKLVIIDPAYIFVTPENDAAGNVFKMGRLLAEVRDVCRRAAAEVDLERPAVIIVHHFTKTGENDLKLSSLTQAGFREVADMWMLMTHAETPDLDDQRFRLRVKVGGRRGYGWSRDMAVRFGPFNPDSMRHDDSEPSWTVEQSTGTGRGVSDLAAELYRHVEANPGMFTKTDLIKDGSLDGTVATRRAAVEQMLDEGMLRLERISRQDAGGKPRQVDVLHPVWSTETGEAL
jgi:hypothetical protein